MSTRICKECNAQLRGRSDQKFCSDYCRSTNYNKVNSESKLMRKIHSILKKNRKILKACLQKHETIIALELLVLEGFRLNYFTHQVNKRGRTTLYYCYDIGYEIDDSNQLKIYSSQ